MGIQQQTEEDKKQLKNTTDKHKRGETEIKNKGKIQVWLLVKNNSWIAPTLLLFYHFYLTGLQQLLAAV